MLLEKTVNLGKLKIWSKRHTSCNALSDYLTDDALSDYLTDDALSDYLTDKGS